MSGFIKLSSVLERSDHQLFFECPGCKMLHGVNVEAEGRPRWGWNGSVDKPTFTPSILVQWEQGEPPCTDLDMAEKIHRGEVVQTKVVKVCHSFVTNGRIQFLGDCTHHLAGKTVDLPLLEDGE
ncbi:MULTISPECIES: DUF6527 family protein [Aeromonas]|uniref:DUF6527 family protein n=1 Tax=Aeromonas TaxID=642 RepID=UPI0015DC2735|nr:DUF6527 family protein [Aeromonas caviae]BBR09272.1 hypothetical protein WP3S18E02_09330 [Aeromonas caviae]